MFLRLKHIFCALLIICVLRAGVMLPHAWAEGLSLPASAARLTVSPAFDPVILKGLVIHPDNALMFDFLIDQGQAPLGENRKSQEYEALIKYFLAALTVPDKNQWVNLSPYEKQRMIEPDFGKTQMGRDLLAQDYLLKQMAASLMYPESGAGRIFWNKVYEKARSKNIDARIPVNAINKVWIVPDQALIYESGNTAYIARSHLKVMLEKDYLAYRKSGVDANDREVTNVLIRDIILPVLEKEINEGKHFAQLRQICSGMLLASWYKKTLKESLLGKIYMDRGKVAGVAQDPENNELIYKRYLEAFKKGVYSYIREEVDQGTHQVTLKKYFSGGINNTFADQLTVTKASQAQLATAIKAVGHLDAVAVNMDLGWAAGYPRAHEDEAMMSQQLVEIWKRGLGLGLTDIVTALIQIRKSLHETRKQQGMDITIQVGERLVRRGFAVFIREHEPPRSSGIWFKIEEVDNDKLKLSIVDHHPDEKPPQEPKTDGYKEGYLRAYRDMLNRVIDDVLTYLNVTVAADLFYKAYPPTPQRPNNTRLAVIQMINIVDASLRGLETLTLTKAAENKGGTVTHVNFRGPNVVSMPQSAKGAFRYGFFKEDYGPLFQGGYDAFLGMFARFLYVFDKDAIAQNMLIEQDANRYWLSMKPDVQGDAVAQLGKYLKDFLLAIRAVIEYDEGMIVPADAGLDEAMASQLDKDLDRVLPRHLSLVPVSAQQSRFTFNFKFLGRAGRGIARYLINKLQHNRIKAAIMQSDTVSIVVDYSIDKARAIVAAMTQDTKKKLVKASVFWGLGWLLSRVDYVNFIGSILSLLSMVKIVSALVNGDKKEETEITVAVFSLYFAAQMYDSKYTFIFAAIAAYVGIKKVYEILGRYQQMRQEKKRIYADDYWNNEFRQAKQLLQEHQFNETVAIINEARQTRLSFRNRYKLWGLTQDYLTAITGAAEETVAKAVSSHDRRLVKIMRTVQKAEDRGELNRAGVKRLRRLERAYQALRQKEIESIKQQQGDVDLQHLTISNWQGFFIGYFRDGELMAAEQVLAWVARRMGELKPRGKGSFERARGQLDLAKRKKIFQQWELDFNVALNLGQVARAQGMLSAVEGFAREYRDAIDMDEYNIKQAQLKMNKFFPAERPRRWHYLRVLGLEPNATKDDIKAAWAQMARDYHPDTHPGDVIAEATYKAASAAYTVLKDRAQMSDALAQDVRGGIDFTKAILLIKRDAKGLPLPVAQQDLAQLSRITGCTPRILAIRPAARLAVLVRHPEL